MSASKKVATKKPVSAAALDALYERRRLDRLWHLAPFVLRITEWKDYPAPVLVLSERGWEEDRQHPFVFDTSSKKPSDPVFASKGVLRERGHLWGEALVRIHPVVRDHLRAVADDAGVSLELDQLLPKASTPFRGNLPLDDEAGSKLALTFRLCERVKDMDRVELIARRVAAFTREEAAYWLSRLIHFGKVRNQWAVSGLRIMLAGDGSGPEVEEELAATKR